MQKGIEIGVKKEENETIDRVKGIMKEKQIKLKKRKKRAFQEQDQAN